MDRVSKVSRHRPLPPPASSPEDSADGLALANGAVEADALTNQLRRMYDAIAEEPIPPALAALLERLER